MRRQAGSGHPTRGLRLQKRWIYMRPSLRMWYCRFMCDVTSAQCCCSGELQFDLVITLSDSTLVFVLLVRPRITAGENNLNAALRISLGSGGFLIWRLSVSPLHPFFSAIEFTFFAVASNARRLSRGEYTYGCHFRTARQRQRCGTPRPLFRFRASVLPEIIWAAEMQAARKHTRVQSVEDGVAGFPYLVDRLTWPGNRRHTGRSALRSSSSLGH